MGAWLVIQICATIFPAWDLPRWSLRAVIVLVLAGFPMALVLAWAFDIKDGQVVMTGEAPDSPPRSIRRPKRFRLILLAIFGIALSGLTGAWLWPWLGARQLDKSVAVLPFDNFSADKQNEHFVDGLHDDLITTLARIGDLKVISRVSVMPYRGKSHNVREIAQDLGVTALVEGSMRRSGNRIRLVVQLIDALNDRHLWAQEYDRDLTDTFALQSALAQEIASQLKARLSPAEAAQIKHRPTTNQEAYDAYVEGHALYSRAQETLDTLVRVEQLYEKATRLDPSFALAYARLSYLESWMYYLLDPTPARLEKARRTADRAVSLAPNLPETHLALGHLAYYGDRDYGRAMTEYNIARQGLPNDPTVVMAIASILRRQGNWKQAAVEFERAASLSPGDPIVIENLGITYAALRDFPAAARAFDRAVQLVPTSFEANSLRAQVDIDWKGDLTAMKRLVNTLPPDSDSFGMATLARFNVHFFERDFPGALNALWRSPLENLHGETSSPLPKSFLAGQVYRLIPDEEKARASYEHALEIANRALDESPQDPARHSLAGLIYAGLGRKEEALREGHRAVEIMPESKDALDGPLLVLALARIYTIVGEPDKAIDLLERLLKIPAGTNVHELRLDPTWDVLRKEPRFQQLIK